MLLGLLLGLNRFAGDVADPILGTVYSIPKITLYPIILLIFGLSLAAKIAFGVIHGIFPVAIFTMNAVRNVAPVHRRTAKALRLSPLATIATVLAPAAVPEILSGIRIGSRGHTARHSDRRTIRLVFGHRLRPDTRHRPP